MAPTTTHDTRLNDYGIPIATYTGDGTLQWATSPAQQVVFDAGQLHDGEALVICSAPLSVTEALLWSFGGGVEEPVIGFEGLPRMGDW